MSIVINSNMAASYSALNMSRANNLLTKSLQRLSSGKRIVSPADDGRTSRRNETAEQLEESRRIQNEHPKRYFILTDAGQRNESCRRNSRSHGGAEELLQ